MNADLKKVTCIYCGYKMPIFYDKTANCKGIYVKCKGRNCGKVFEIVIKKENSDK